MPSLAQWLPTGGQDTSLRQPPKRQLASKLGAPEQRLGGCPAAQPGLRLLRRAARIALRCSLDIKDTASAKKIKVLDENKTTKVNITAGAACGGRMHPAAGAARACSAAAAAPAAAPAAADLQLVDGELPMWLQASPSVCVSVRPQPTDVLRVTAAPVPSHSVPATFCRWSCLRMAASSRLGAASWCEAYVFSVL